MRLTSYLVVLVTTAYFASWVDTIGTLLGGLIFNGTASGIFALLGVVLGILDESILKRLGVVILGTLGLSAVFVLRPQFNGWEFLLSLVRLFLLSVSFGIVRIHWHVVFTSRRPSQPTAWENVKLWHLFGFTSIAAMFLALVRFLKDYDGPGEGVFMLAVTVTVGIFAATVPLTAAFTAMGARDLLHGASFALPVAMLAACMGIFSFSQTNSIHTGLQWSVNSVVEALTVAIGVFLLRLQGYRLGHLQPDRSIG